MSYDIYLRGVKCPTCSHQEYGPSLPEPTYNLTPIFDLALTGEDLPNPGMTPFQEVILKEPTDRPRGLRVLNGKTGKDSLPVLVAAMDRLNDPTLRDRFVALQPANGWGDLRGGIQVLEELLGAARDNPDLTWEIR